MDTAKSLLERQKNELERQNNEAEILKNFNKSVLDYEYTISKVEGHAISIGVEWGVAGSSRELYINLGKMEKQGIHWSDICSSFKFPVSEIPRVIAELEKIHLVATNAIREV